MSGEKIKFRKNHEHESGSLPRLYIRNIIFIDSWRVHVMNVSGMRRALFFNTKFWWKDHSLIFLSFALYSTIWERWLLAKCILFKSYSGEINFESHCFSFYSTSLNLFGPNKIFFDISFTSFEFKKVAQYF